MDEVNCQYVESVYLDREGKLRECIQLSFMNSPVVVI